MPATRFTDVRRFASLDSTNRYLVDEARLGAPEGVVAVADHQTAGRGRLGRRWEAPPGANLLASVLLRPPAEPAARHLVVAVVALAAADAARDVAGVELGIKWPNDLVAADGRKVAGVLAEADLATPTSPDGLPAPVVVGVGMNVGWPTGPGDLPAELVGRAASLAELAGRPVDRDALLDAVLAGLEGRRADLDTPAGRHRQAGALRRACTTLGAEVRVDLGDAVVEGTARDLTPEGHLVVATGTGDRTVVAGDVVHLRPAPAPGGDGPGG